MLRGEVTSTRPVEEVDYPEEHCPSAVPSFFDGVDAFLEKRDLLLRASRHENEPAARERADKLLTSLKKSLDAFQEEPNLLDPHLESILSPTIDAVHDAILKSDPLRTPHRLFKFIYHVGKVRGYKTTIRFFTHEAADVEPVYSFLLAQNRDDAHWETRYVLLLWLSLLCRIPFDLEKIDSGAGETSLVSRITDTAKSYLGSTGLERDASSILLARILVRKDVIGPYLRQFLTWAKENVTKTDNAFLTTGILSVLCEIYQIGERAALLPTSSSLYECLQQLDATSESWANVALMRKQTIKLASRIGLCFLKPRVASWRYQRGNRSLSINVRRNEDVDAGCDAEDGANQQDNSDDDDDIPDIIEDVIERLLGGLRDKDTIARWSAAKGLGRITERLPVELAQDVLGSLVDLFEEDTFETTGQKQRNISAASSHTWHGACLALAEVTRRGLLLPEIFERAIPWIVQAVTFDQKRGSHSVGANVRDAACYICWSLARAYDSKLLLPCAETLATTLFVVSAFDREVNVRRAASAAFQEHVGRMGLFPHGIDVLTLADYFTVGNRVNMFTEVAPTVAKFDEYRSAIIEHLAVVSSSHWDKTVRHLAANALGNITPLAVDHLSDRILPLLLEQARSGSLEAAHGAMLAIGNIVHAVGSCLGPESPATFSKPIFREIAMLPSSIPNSALNTFGSEHTREGVVHLIASLSKAKWPIDPSRPEDNILLNSWRKLLDSTLERKEEWLQTVAVEAIEDFAKTYGVTSSTLDEYVKQAVVSNVKFRQRGLSLALGRLLPYVDAEQVDRVLGALFESTRPSKDTTTANDAESRRNAVIGLNTIAENALSRQDIQLSSPQLETMIDCYLDGLKDYSKDQRGDVGSWVREGCMKGLAIATKALNNDRLLRAKRTAVVAGLLRQSVERIDRIRACAGGVVRGFIYFSADENVSEKDAGLPGKEILEVAIPREGFVNWVSPAEVYQRMIPVLRVPEYRHDVLVGMIVSAGGLTESLVRHSSSTLLSFVDAASRREAKAGDLTLKHIAEEFCTIFDTYKKDNRIIVPLMEFIGLLSDNGTLFKLEDSIVYAKLFDRIKREASRCRDVRKLRAYIKILCNLAALADATTKMCAISECLTLLIHPFPMVRRTVAEQLYMAISSTCDVEVDNEAEDGSETLLKNNFRGKAEEAEEILISTDWDLPVSDLRASQRSLCSLLTDYSETGNPSAPP